MAEPNFPVGVPSPLVLLNAVNDQLGKIHESNELERPYRENTHLKEKRRRKFLEKYIVDLFDGSFIPHFYTAVERVKNSQVKVNGLLEFLSKHMECGDVPCIFEELQKMVEDWNLTFTEGRYLAYERENVYYLELKFG
jgi:hypothetical protein